MANAFDPGKPDGRNGTLDTAISPDGVPVLGTRYRVPPRSGAAVLLLTGQRLVIENTHGTQVCDFWAFNAADLGEYLSTEHMHAALSSIYPKAGDRLVSNRRRPIIAIEQDTSPGVHDTVIAACDWDRYQGLGCTEYHDNCTDNLRMALMAIGYTAPAVPAPFNIWMNTPVAADGTVSWLPPASKAGDTITLRAEFDCVAVMSACPQDLIPINGAANTPTELHFHVEAAKLGL